MLNKAYSNVVDVKRYQGWMLITFTGCVLAGGALSYASIQFMMSAIEQTEVSGVAVGAKKLAGCAITIMSLLLFFIPQVFAELRDWKKIQNFTWGVMGFCILQIMVSQIVLAESNRNVMDIIRTRINQLDTQVKEKRENASAARLVAQSQVAPSPVSKVITTKSKSNSWIAIQSQRLVVEQDRLKSERGVSANNSLDKATKASDEAALKEQQLYELRAKDKKTIIDIIGFWPMVIMSFGLAVIVELSGPILFAIAGWIMGVYLKAKSDTPTPLNDGTDPKGKKTSTTAPAEITLPGSTATVEAPGTVSAVTDIDVGDNWMPVPPNKKHLQLLGSYTHRSMEPANDAENPLENQASEACITCIDKDAIKAAYKKACAAPKGKEINCPWCATTFTKTRSNHRFCLPNHRDEYWNALKPERVKAKGKMTGKKKNGSNIRVIQRPKLKAVK